MNNYQNILIVMGTGRNIGKTVTACNLIQNLSKKHRTVGVKISPHFHELEPNLKYLRQSEEIVVVEEQHITEKDSSQMLQAGAKKVFYVQVKNEKLADAFDLILKSVDLEQPIVVESGGLYEIIEPGLLFFITGEKPKKEIKIRKGTNVVKMNSGEVRNFEWNSIQFKNGNFMRYA